MCVHVTRTESLRAELDDTKRRESEERAKLLKQLAVRTQQLSQSTKNAMRSAEQVAILQQQRKEALLRRDPRAPPLPMALDNESVADSFISEVYSLLSPRFPPHAGLLVGNTRRGRTLGLGARLPWAPLAHTTSQSAARGYRGRVRNSTFSRRRTCLRFGSSGPTCRHTNKASNVPPGCTGLTVLRRGHGPGPPLALALPPGSSGAHDQ